VPAELVAREIYAQLSTPLLWRFLQDMPARGNDWAAHIVDRLQQQCGQWLGSVWKITLTRREAPALWPSVRDGEARLGDLMRSPHDRSQPLPAVPLLLQHGEESILGPEDDVALAPDDQLLVAGDPPARRYLLDTMTNPAVAEYVLHNRSVPSGWLWQRVTGRVPR
jgi:voltage-gated potassium channel